jgi:class 3 adenylate cyclase/tetratricopeptide (TPR) repeat protein
MNHHTAEQTGLNPGSVRSQEMAKRGESPKACSDDRQHRESELSIEERMQGRAKNGQELNQHLTRHLCVMFADVVGSTAFYQQHGDIQGRQFIQRHYDTLSPLIAQHNGKVIKTIGDAVMASFDEPKEAFDCSIAIQHKLWETNQQHTDHTPLQTKISLHYGTALVETNDIFGDLVNMSARLNSLVEPDQILISHAVYDLVKEHRDLPILPLELVQWKDGEQGLAVYEVLWRQKEDGADLPMASRDLGGAYQTCFDCGLKEHPVTKCPSKQLTRIAHRLDRLGYQPLRKILGLFQQADLGASTPIEPQGEPMYDAFYEVSLPYQLRFLIRVWLATTEDWSEIERQHSVVSSSLTGTRLWKGLDCLRVGQLDNARGFLLSALESTPGDYKLYSALGFWGVEKGDPYSALKYWRQGLSLTTTTLQAAYLHLLMHRLYAINGQTELAQQELRRALSKDFYLSEAKYSQMALLAKEGEDNKLLNQLPKLIQDDRSVYLKVLLDPNLASFRRKLYPVLSKILKEARSAGFQQMSHLTEELNALREWYQQPEEKLTAIERAVGRVRDLIKSNSYYGYRDAADAGEILPKKIRAVLERRKTHLGHEYAVTLDTVKRHLDALTSSPDPVSKGSTQSRLAKIQQALSQLQTKQSFDTANQFWRAWKDLQALKLALQQLDPTTKQSGFFAPGNNLRHVLLYGLSSSILVDTTFVGVVGYLTYFSHLRLPQHRWFLYLAFGALGGFLVGSVMGWLVQRYRHPR